MSATSSTRAPDQIMNPANTAFAKIEEMLDNPPQEAHGNSLAIAITSWVAGVITFLLSYLHSALRNLHDFNADILARIEAIETAPPHVVPHDHGGVPTDRPNAGASRLRDAVASDLEPPAPNQAEAPARESGVARRQQRCSKCHARGHSPQSCMTADPASMRKRIAGNQKARRSARSKATPGPIPVLVPPPPQSLYAAYHTTADATALTSTIADAEELRRRKRQSGRDRKKHRAATAISG